MASGIQDFENQLKTNMQNSFTDIQSTISNQQMNTTVAETMRSFKDQMSFNLQSLNLTLSTLNSSMNNLGSKISGLSPNSAGRYIESGLQPGSFLGTISRNYANAQGQFTNPMSAFLGNSAFIERPYNINPMEFYTGAQMQRDFYMPKLAANVLSGVIGAITPGTTLSTMALSGFWQGTHGYMDTADMIRRMSGRFSTGGTMNQNGALSVAKGIQRLGYDELMQSTSMDNRLGYSGYKDIAALGLQTDMFKGKTPEDLLRQIRDAGKVVKLLTGVMGSQDVQEAMQSLTQMRNMGVNVATMPGVAKSLLQNSYGYGYGSGMTGGQMLNAGMQIAQAGLGTHGIPAGIGVQQGMQNLAYVNEMRKRGLLSDADLVAGGGAQSIAARMLGITGNVLNSGFGQTVLAAGLSGGGFNAMQAQSVLQNGGIVGTVGAGIGNLLSGEGLFANSAYMTVHRNRLLADLIKQDPNALQKITGTTLRLEMQHNPAYNALGLRGKRDMMAQHLMYNYGQESSTALMQANMTLDPTIARETEYLNRIAQARSDLDRSRVYGSIGAQFSRAVIDPIEKAGERYIVQPMVNLGENITNWFKRREQNRDVGAALIRGNDLLYSPEIDKNGRRTGVKNRISAAQFEKLISSEDINAANNVLNKEENYASSQYIRAANTIANGGGGTFFRTLGADVANGIGWVFGGSDYDTNEKIFGRAMGDFKRAFKKDFDVITESPEKQFGGAEDLNYTINRMVKDRRLDFSLQSPGKILSDYELRESGRIYENNPFAHGMDIIRRSGIKNGTALEILRQDKASQGAKEFASNYLNPLMGSFQNLSPFDSESVLRTYSTFIAEGKAEGYTEGELASAFYNYKQDPKNANSFNMVDVLQRTNTENALAVQSTKQGEALRFLAGTTRAGTSDWKTGEFMNLTAAGNLTSDVLSNASQNIYERMQNDVGITKDTLALLKDLHKQSTAGGGKLTYGEFLSTDPDLQRKWAKSIVSKGNRGGANIDKELAKLKKIIDIAGRDIGKANKIAVVGGVNDAFTAIAGQSGKILNATGLIRDSYKYGKLGALSAAVFDNLEAYEDQLAEYDTTSLTEFKSGVADLNKLRNGDNLRRDELGNLSKFFSQIREERSNAKTEKDKKALETKTKNFLEGLGFKGANAEKIEQTITKIDTAAFDTTTASKRLDDVKETQTESALARSVESAIDSVVATVNGAQVALVLDAKDNFKKIEGDRKALKDEIKQIKLENTSLFSKYTAKSDVGSIEYRQG